MKENKNIVVEISPKTILFATLFPLLIFFLWIVRDLLFSLLIGFILMSALRPAVKFLGRKKVPHTASVLIVYLAFVAFFAALISLISTPIINETSAMIRSLPDTVRHLNPQWRDALKLNDLTQYLPNVTNNVFGFISSVFSNTLFVVSTLFFGLYFLMDEDLIVRFLSKYLSEHRTIHISSIFKKAESRMSSWFWGELTLMTVVGLLTYVGLTLVGMKYALPLAILAGLLEVVPTIGPVMSSIPAILLAMTISPFSGLYVGAIYFIVQQLENNLIVPFIMRKAVGINPIITLIALIIGGRIGGVLGILLSIPLFLFLETVITEVLRSNGRVHKKQEAVVVADKER